MLGAAAVADKVDLQLLPAHAGSKDPARRVAVALRHFVRMSEIKPVWGLLIVRMIPASDHLEVFVAAQLDWRSEGGELDGAREDTEPMLHL